MCDFLQFFAECDDVDAWMLDVLRLVSSEDVGRDEASVQALIKKHDDVTDDLNNFTKQIEILHSEAGQLAEPVGGFLNNFLSMAKLFSISTCSWVFRCGSKF